MRELWEISFMSLMLALNRELQNLRVTFAARRCVRQKRVGINRMVTQWVHSVQQAYIHAHIYMYIEREKGGDRSVYIERNICICTYREGCRYRMHIYVLMSNKELNEIYGNWFVSNYPSTGPMGSEIFIANQNKSFLEMQFHNHD